MPPIRLSDSELDAVMAAARPLPVHLRDPFLHAVAHALSDRNVIGPGTASGLSRAAAAIFRPAGFEQVQRHIEVSLSWLLGPDCRGLSGRGLTSAATRHRGAALLGTGGF